MDGFLVLVHVVTAGKQSDDLGTDESPIILLTLAVFEPAQSKSLLLEQYVISDMYENELKDSKIKNNILTEDCILETGLNELIFNRAQSFEATLSNIHNSLVNIGLKFYPQKNFNIIVDGQMPLRLALHSEVVRKDIELSKYDYYYEFIDLRKDFKTFYNKEKIQTLEEMIQECNIFINDTGGNYGIIQCHKMLEIVRKMSDEGNKWRGIEIINKHYYSSIVKKSDAVNDDVVVRARGLPWQATDNDINRFFQGLNIARGGIALVLSKVGRRNGEALIRFEHREHRDIALRKHKHHMGQRYIEVYMATGRDFIQVAGGETEEAENFLLKFTKPSQTLIRMRGLPYTATANHILEFFSSSKCTVEFGEDGILFVNHKDGRATGDAFVIFESESIAEEALKSHRENIGNRYIELFKSTPAEVNQVMNSVLNPNTSSPVQEDSTILAQLTMNGNLFPLLPGQIPIVNTSYIDPGRNFVRIKGMPLETSVNDIINYLDHLGHYISYQGVHIVYNSLGQPAGEAILQMVNETAAAAVVEAKHKQLFTISSGKKSMVDVSACSSYDIAQFSGFIQSPSPYNQNQIQMQNALYQLQLLQKQIVSPAGFAINQVSYPQYWPYISSQQNATINGLIPATSNQLLNSQLMNGYMCNFQGGNPGPRLSSCSQPPSLSSPIASVCSSYIPNTISQAQAQGLLFSPQQTPTALFIPNLGLIQAPDCSIVVFRNLPKDVVLEEILGVLDPILQQGVMISDIKVGISSDNSPTGEAFIAFANRSDAERSVVECRNRFVRNVPIDISLI